MDFDLFDYYLAVPEADYNEKFNSLFLKTKTPQDIIGLLFFLIMEGFEYIELCRCTTTELELEAYGLLDWAEKNLTHIPAAESYKIFKYNLLLFHKNRARFDKHFRNIFHDLLENDYSSLGIDKNPFKLLVYGDLNNITPAICRTCCAIFRFNESETGIATIPEKGILEAEGGQIKTYTWKRLQTLVGIKISPKGFQERLKKSVFWNNEVSPASTGQRVTKIKCKPSFIETYRKYIQES